RGGNVGGTGINLLYQFPQIGHHGAERRLQCAKLIAPVTADVHGQVAGGNPVGHLNGLSDRCGDGPDHGPGNNGRRQQGDDGDGDQQGNGAVVLLLHAGNLRSEERRVGKEGGSGGWPDGGGEDTSRGQT